ncbi:stage V sporulation protein AD [uncultured Gemmiger sp.]|uniref:stage V sporulation protein AD n=1 Tax=uncultured Gemmiger sp. TaxID=1623490 RepID=UPI0025EF9B58|nr:stage V sporulation protein AD [uncultured Gemmiger sp.]
MPVRSGDTLIFSTPPVVRAWACAGGKKEAEGPLAVEFDLLFSDTSFGCGKWEKAESLLQQKCVARCLTKAGLDPDQVDLAFGGDLQAQCTASNYTMRWLGAPYAGLYGACSTMAEGLALAACFAAAGFARQALAFTSSHFCAAERQFRTPLDYGGKRTTTAQWTATAAGACILSPGGGQAGVPVTSVTFGRVQDYEVHDINNMGAAMMPAAVSTLCHHFADTATRPADYDAIFTGDLGRVGSGLLHDQMRREGLPLENHLDCGCLLYDVDTQQVQAGGSGAGCSAAVLCAHVLPRLMDGRWRRVLFLSTGALMSQTTYLQGESIPGIAHAVELAAPDTVPAKKEA